MSTKELITSRNGKKIYRVTDPSYRKEPFIVKCFKDNEKFKLEKSHTTAAREKQGLKNFVIDIEDYTDDLFLIENKRKSAKKHKKKPANNLHEETYCYWMDDLEDMGYQSLEKYFYDICPTRTKNRPLGESFENLKSLFLQLFTVVKSLKSENISHCNFDPKNIYVRIDNEKDVSIQIAGFEDSVTDYIKRCKKVRTTNEVILSVFKQCSGLSSRINQNIDLLSELIYNKKCVDSDLTMYVTMLSILFTDIFGEQFFKTLYELSYGVVCSKNPLQKKFYLKTMEHMITEMFDLAPTLKPEVLSSSKLISGLLV
jgi:hypothetical protein